MMKCSKCQFENPDNTKICGECGANLEILCPNCKHPNPPGFKFCGECGHNLSISSEALPKELSFEEKITKVQKYLPKGLTQKILAQRDRIEGEHKQVTVMFCDMEGFTPLTEKLGPEQMYSMMDEIYEILIHKVHDNEGTVNELTGDGIMALFGAPIALEDAPQRAIRSALAIHQEMNRYSDRKKQEKGIPALKMRIGIHTGPVVVGTLGNDLRVDFKAVGDTVNLASRMEGLAEPGTTYVTEDTFKLAEGFFRFGSLGKREIKGKEKPVSVYQVIAASTRRTRLDVSAERGLTPFVGRDEELNTLELAVLKAITGQGSIVNVIGEAGIGKSRLIAELKNREVMKRVTLLEGSAISMGANLGYHLIIDLLKNWSQITEDDSEVAAFTKLESAIRATYPEALGEVLPFVATLMGIKLVGRYADRMKGIEGEALDKLILKNVRDLVTRGSQTTPLVAILEDLHWADTSSIELMESLFRLATKERIVFINMFRPGYTDTGGSSRPSRRTTLKSTPRSPFNL
jgi:class 3 adenylate cyclase